MNRRQFLSAAAAGMATGLLPQRGSAAARKPNVLLIIADEWRAQAFGHAGDSFAHTPAIDAFARASFTFPNATSGTPVCCPARASLLTGQYPLQHGVYINDVPLEPKGPTLAEVFAGAGYDTGYIGKWHLYGSPDGRFSRRLDFIPPEKRCGFRYWKACECTHDYKRSLYYEGNDPAPKYWPEYDAIAQTKDAIGFIAGRSGASNPFFLALSWGPPHYPYVAPQKYSDRFAARAIGLRANVPASAHVAATEELRGYYAALAVLDDCLHSLMSALAESGLDENTIVVFMSDHGDMLYSQGLTRKLVPWEESVAIPLFIRCPRAMGMRPGSSRIPIGIPDIMPTLLGLAGLRVPASVTGTDYSPVLQGRRVRKAATSAYLSMPAPAWHARMSGVGEFRGVRTDRYTYVRSIVGPWLLYDNKADPYQMSNRVDDPALASVRNELDAELGRWRQALGDGFLPAAAYLERDGLTHYLETQVPVGIARSPWGDWTSTLPVPASQPRSVNASFDELMRDPLTAKSIASLVPELEKITALDWRPLSPYIINVLRRDVLPDHRLAELDRRLRQIREL